MIPIQDKVRAALLAHEEIERQSTLEHRAVMAMQGHPFSWSGSNVVYTSATEKLYADRDHANRPD